MDAEDTTQTILTARKTEAVLRHLRGEELDALSWELGIPKNRIAAWSRAFVHGGEVFLNHLDLVDRTGVAREKIATLVKFGPGCDKRPDFSSGRCFVPAEYRPVQRHLTLRSVPMQRGERLLDVRFERVFYAEMMDLFSGLMLAEPTVEESGMLERRCGQPADASHFYFVLSTGVVGMQHPRPRGERARMAQRRMYIGAGAVRIEELGS